MNCCSVSVDFLKEQPMWSFKPMKQVQLVGLWTWYSERV